MHSNTQMTGKQLYIRLLSYVRPYWKALVVSALLLALLAATEPLFPMLIKPLLDDGFTNKDSTFIRLIPFFIVGISMVRGILLFTSSYASRWLSTHVVKDLRNQAFSHLMDLPVKFFDNNSSGALASKIAYDVNNVTGAATTVITTLIRDSLTITALLVWLLWMNWKLTIITFILIPPFALVLRYFNNRMRNLSSENQMSMAQLTHLVEQSSHGQKVIKTFLGKQSEVKQFKKANAYQRGIAMRFGIATWSIVPITQIITSFAIAIVIGVAISGTNEATSTAGGFMSFLTAMLLLLQPIKRLAGLSPILQKGLAAAESVFEIIDTPSENDHGKQTVLPPYGDIQYENVTFAYEKTIILDKINLTITHGKTIAFIGQSGSGKTTLINLLPRFYEVDSGTIYIGKIPVQNISLKVLRQQIALVTQDVQLFNDTIASNVAYGETKNINHKERIVYALKKAHAWELVKHMPDGVETQIGQNGVKLSGGQRQRIAIARAFMKDAPILILDEATSALDTKSEKHVQSALEGLMKNRTTIIIAHRLSTIEKSDWIVVMDSGKIIEQGSHSDLIKQNGQYKQFRKLQFTEL